MDATSRTIKKNRSSDIVLVLKTLEGAKPLSSKGLADPRLFTGDNQLHAIMDPQTTFWYLKYDQGVLPEPFKQRFTSFSLLLAFVTDYYKKRNIEITEIQD